MKVARWVREETGGYGLSPGNHLKYQAGRDSISTSLAVYFISNDRDNARYREKGFRAAQTVSTCAVPEGAGGQGR